ncbi:transcriptional regulator PefB [Salmonella enterica]|nr:transcriptional regulator PefB [Salmonella enterica]EME0489287.1 transcriptional regulator PefB [Salmonella enterica]
MMLNRKDADYYLGKEIMLARIRRGALIPAKVNEEHFWLLIGISSIHSEKIIQALRDYLVFGVSRKGVCERYEVNNGYFSTSLNRLSRISQAAAQMVVYYS